MIKPGDHITRWASPLFVAFCAALMTLETHAVTGTPFEYNIIPAIFSGALLAYSAAGLRVTLTLSSVNPISVTGSVPHFALACASLICLIPFSSLLYFHQALWLTAAAALSFLYMIPVRFAGRTYGRWRIFHPWKNIIVSAVWTLATVVIPLNVGPGDMGSPELLLLCARRFIFIYCLATLYDVPDAASDKMHQAGTIPVRFGHKAALITAGLALFVFSLLTVIDTFIETNVAGALILSAAYTLGIIMLVNPFRRRQQYRMLVDSAMAVQALLVLIV